MSNSSLVSHIRISPNRTSPRNHAIDTITIHCVVGQVTVERLGEIFAPTSRKASCNYGIGKDGRIGMYCEEKDRSWCSSNAANDHRAITIEVASDTTHPYAVNDKAMASLINLCVDICKRNGIKKLVWSTNKNDRVNHLNGCNMTVHRDYAAKSCPGEYLYNKHQYIADEVNKKLNVGETPTKNEVNGINHTSYSQQEFIDFVANVAINDYKNHKILPSITIAQAIKESGWGKSELAQKANALFGIKKNGWSGQTYRKVATEQLPDGTYVTTQDKVEWRKYNSWRDSIVDHGEYLCTRKVGNQQEPNWKNLIGETNLDKALDYLQGAQYKYATSLTYKESLKNDYILKYGLQKYDKEVLGTKEEVQEVKKLYRVRKSWEDAKSQTGAYAILENGIANCQEGYSVFDWNGNVVYSKQSVFYKVVKGDTLGAIAKKHNTTVEALVKLNDISNPNKIYVGQKIKIK